MKQKLVMSFVDKDGIEVPVLSRVIATPPQVQAALQFLEVGYTLSISVVECDDEGNTVTSDAK